MSNGHKEVAVPGNVRTDLAKENVNNLEPVGGPELQIPFWWNW